jgi:hypothetical protein
MLLNDLMKQLDEAMDKSTGPKFTGYWKAKDSGTPGKKMVGSESVNNEEVNPTDKVTMDIPLFIRMLEYAKEDAKTDMDLHDLTERAIQLMKEHDYLCMDNYDTLVGGKESVDEFKDTAQFSDDSGKNINHEIFLLLKSGATVYSNAAGRMGQVVSANNDGVTIKSKRGKGFTSFNSGDKVKIEKVEGKPNHYHVVNTVNEGWKDVAKVGAALGIAGGMGVAGKYADDHAQRVQIGNTQAYVVTNPSAGIIPPDAKTVKGADGKMYKVWIKGGEPRTGSTKNMFATPVSEGKIKGKDGKACWKGYRYAGTENGKDKCVPVKKGK